MVQALVRRERRTLWVTLIPIFAIAVGACLFAAASERGALTARAETEATSAGQSELMPLLTPRDLAAPIIGDRAEELGGQIEAGIVSEGPVASVRLYSASGRILFDADPSLVNLRPTYLRDLLKEVTTDGPRSEVRSGMLQTYVPLRLASSGTVAVAELSQPFGPIASEARMPWLVVAVVLGIALVASIVLFVLSRRAEATAPVTAVVHGHPAFRAAEEARLMAEQRATATEAAFEDLQAQFRLTLDELKAMEEKVTMFEHETTGSEDEIRALRDQLRDTAERLQQVELDNAALRERFSARQRELDESRAQLAQIKEQGPSEELAELRRRVEIAERRATEMETEVERIEAELDHAANRFHMAKLTEALREFDNDAVADEDDILEHPKVIFTTPQRVSPER